MKTMPVAASVCEPALSPPQRQLPGLNLWITRSSTFVVSMIQATAAATWERVNQPDEFMVFLPEGSPATLKANGKTVHHDGSTDALAIVPPGPSTITLPSAGWVYAVTTTLAQDLATAAGNAQRYAGAAETTVLAPAPPNGWQLRYYVLRDYNKPDSPARPFRSSNMLLNPFIPRDFRRDTRKMSPHVHEEFDQASLALQGSFIHHLRYPWIPDMTQWRDDDHVGVGSPSVIIMPAGVIHTSQDTGDGWAQLIDIFAPPRPDFAERPGWICNESDYAYLIEGRT